LIEKATVDAYDEEEHTTGFYTMIDEDLALPSGPGCLASRYRSLRSRWTMAASKLCARTPAHSLLGGNMGAC
jgi:hypothetical protein